MDLWTSGSAAAVLIFSAAGLMAWHVHTWKVAKQEPPDSREYGYRRNQFRRCMQTSAMLGLLGAAIFIGQVVMLWVESRLFTVIYWSGVLLLLLWMALLAMADMLASYQHFSRLRSECQIERAKLQAEVRRLKSATNGKAPNSNKTKDREPG